MKSFNLPAGDVTASLVVSPVGSAVSTTGTSRGLGNETDLELLKWFRARSQIVLTSGKTAELENYRYPSSTGLAILSRHQRTYDSLATDRERVLFLKEVDTYPQAIDELINLGFHKIHCEFGPNGFVELVDGDKVDGFVSSIEPSGIKRFAELHNLSVAKLQDVAGDLVVGQLLGRG